MAKFKLPPPGPSTGLSTGPSTLNSRELLQLNPTLFAGIGGDTRSYFVAEMAREERDDFAGFPHVVSVKFHIFVNYNPWHQFINNRVPLGLQWNDWKHFPNGQFQGLQFLNNCEEGSLMKHYEEPNVIGPRGDGNGIFPDLNEIFKSSYKHEHGRVAQFHHHFTQVLGHAHQESVLDWQLRILVKCFKIILDQTDEASTTCFWKNGLDKIAFHLERMNQELRFIQVLTLGSNKLGDKPMLARMYYDMLSEASLMQSPWPDDDQRHELEFFPEISDLLFRFRSFPPGHPPSGGGDTDDSSSNDSH